MTLPGLLAPQGQRWRLVLLVVLALLQGAALALAAGGTRAAFAGLESDGAVPAVAIATTLGAGLALALLAPALRLIGEAMGQAYVELMRRALLDHAMHSEARALAARRRGHLTMRLAGDMASLRDGLALGLPPLVQLLALLPAGLTVVAMIDPPTARLATAALLGILLAQAASLPSLGAAQIALRRDRARLTASMTEKLPLAVDLAVLGRRRHELAALRRLSRDLQAKARGWLVRTEAVAALPGAVMAALGAWLLYSGSRRGLVAGELAAMLAALGLITLALRDFGTALGRIVALREVIRRCNALLARPLSTLLSGHQRLGRAAPRVEITDPDGLLLDSLGLSIAAGAECSVTLRDPLRLAQILSRRAANPGLGIRIGGIALEDLSSGSIRRGVEIIDDAPPLIRGSLRRCLTLGETARPADRLILSRLERAGLAGTLVRIGGLDARIEEGGRLRSRDDRVLISVMRLVVRRVPLALILAARDMLPPEAERALACSGATRLLLVGSGEDRATFRGPPPAAGLR